MSDIKLSEKGDIQVMVTDLMSVLGVNSKATISNYVAKGMPYIEVGKQKAYEVRRCLEWCYLNSILDLPLPKIDEIDENSVDNMPPSMQKDWYEAQLKKEKLAEVRGETVQKQDVVQDAMTVGMALRDKLMSISSRLASTLASEDDPKEIKKEIEREIRHALEDVSSAFME